MKSKHSFFYIFLFYICFFLPEIIIASELKFEGSEYEIITVQPPVSTGLNNIYVAYDTKNLNLIYYPDNVSDVRFYRYSNLGGGYSEEINNVSFSDNSYIINNIEGDLGYIIEEKGQSFYFWLTDYSKHYLTIQSLQQSEDDSDCDFTSIRLTGNASPIYYYTINGKQEILSRNIEVNFTTLVWDELINNYKTEQIYKTYEYLNEFFNISPPNYCNTYYEISGDLFLERWNKGVKYSSPLIEARAVDVHTIANVINEGDGDSSNQINTETNGLGGSAPLTVEFLSFSTDAVAHSEWQIADNEEFNNPEYRLYETDLNYTFTEEGTKFIRFIGSNYDGTCESFGETYTVSIGASELLIPNAFSPNDDGINDIWKVSYRSIIDFKCWIFDRQGHQIFYFDDINSGWDGTQKGKKVKPGVYYYVIQATGADGKNYKKSGDINILKFRGTQNSEVE